ncbi:MAG: hypothetical protein HC902_11710, partial [Calothrix sp. SM1_5_4]|nr:hypothetical protein [Calothrix sp. SM1_5_4]
MSKCPLIRFLALIIFWAAAGAPLWSARAAHAEGTGWVDHSHEIFLTRDLRETASNYRDYPLFWWNFVVLEG